MDRILFPRKEEHSKKLKKDIILALNKALQKVEESALIQLNRVKYLQSGAILALLTKKANKKALLKSCKNISIKTVKIIDIEVVRVETLQYWQCLKVYRMPLDRY